MGFRHKKRAITTASLLSLAFLSRPVLAESQIYKHEKGGRLIYMHGVKTQSIKPRIFEKKLGRFMLMHCNSNNAFMVFEKGVVHAINSEVAQNIKIKKFKGAKGIAAKIEGSVAAIVMSDKSVIIYRDIWNGPLTSIRSPSFDFIDLHEGRIEMNNASSGKIGITLISGGKIIIIQINANVSSRMSIQVMSSNG